MSAGLAEVIVTGFVKRFRASSNGIDETCRANPGFAISFASASATLLLLFGSD